MKKHVVASLAAIGMAFALPVSVCAQSTSEIDELKAQLAELTRKIEELEKNAQLEKTARQQPDPSKPAWTDRISLKGDFRYRFEGIDEDGLDNRDRQRIRARVMLNGEVSDTTRVGFEVSTGGSNPRSRDATLDGDGSAKDFDLRQAYLRWQPLDALGLTAGKMPQPWSRNPVEYFYDSDYMPEGLAVGFTAGGGFGGTAYWFQIDERGSDDDTSVLGGELGYTGEMFYATVSYQDFREMDGFNPCYQGNCNGNTVDANGNLVNDYNIVQLRGGVKLAGFDVFGSWARNDDADEDTAYSFGAVYGTVKEPGSWSLAALYQDMEADALYGGMIDATFAGGRSAHDGYSIKGAYAITKNWTGSLIYFSNNIDKLADERDYQRYQLDLLWKF